MRSVRIKSANGGTMPWGVVPLCREKAAFTAVIVVMVCLVGAGLAGAAPADPPPAAVSDTQVAQAGVVGAPSIPATCRGAERTQINRAVQRVSSLPEGRGGVDHARSLVSRAANACRYGRFAYAVALQTARKAPVAGARASVGRIVLVSTATGWQLHPVLTVRGLRTDKDPADAARALNGLVVRTRGGALWSADPTAFKASPAVQAQVIRELRRARGREIRLLAIPSARGMAHPTMQRSLSAMLVPAALTYVVTAENAAPSDPVVRKLGDATARRAARSLASTWPRFGTRWATSKETRTLAQATAARVTIRRTNSARALNTKVRAALKAAPKVQFQQVPAQAFYPWPRDGVRDAVQVKARIDKPGTLEVRVFDTTGVRFTKRYNVDPGTWVGAWDGTLQSGGTAPPGAYKWSLTATDLAGNTRRLPGPGTFTVARDKTPPKVVTATTRVVARSGSRADIAASWKIDEPLSPKVTVQLVVRGPARKVGALGRSLEGNGQTTISGLPKGTYRAYLRVYDGSGNMTLAPAGTLVLR